MTNNIEVASSYGGYAGPTSKRYFKEDPNNPHQLICLPCSEEIGDALMEMNLDDKDKKVLKNA